MLPLSAQTVSFIIRPSVRRPYLRRWPVSLRAVIWAQDHAPVDDSTGAAVLGALARSTDEHGRGAWPSVKTIMKRTRLSESSVRRGLRSMEKSGVIRRGDQSLVTHLRADDRPIVWDIAMPDVPRGAPPAPRTDDRGVPDRHPVNDRGVSEGPQRGVSLTGTGCHTDTQEELREDQESLSLSDPVTALVHAAAVVPAGDDERDFITWMNIKFPDRGIGWWRKIEANGDLAAHATDWKHQRDTTPKRRPRPPWCGHCDERTRLYERDDGRMAKCTCHPEHPTHAEPAEPTPPPRPADPDPPSEPVGTTMTAEERQAVVEQGRAELRRTTAAKKAGQARPVKEPAPPRDATPEEKEHQRRQMAAAERYTQAIAGGMSHGEAERYAREDDPDPPPTPEGPPPPKHDH